MTDYDKLKAVFDDIGVEYELLSFKIVNTLRVMHNDDGCIYKGDFDFHKNGKFLGNDEG